RWRFDPTLVLRLAVWMRAQRVSVVHTHLFTADAFGRVAARLAGVRAVFSTVHSVVNVWKTPVHRFIDRALAWASYRVIACTSEVHQTLIERDRLPASRVTTIANGIDLQRFSSACGTGVREEFGVAPNKALLAVVGRLEPPKGHADLLGAFSELRARGCGDFVCLFIGEGQLHAELQADVARRHLQDFVVFTGLRRDVPRLLAACDLFLMPSRWEGLPIALLEAMACGKAVLATAVGGVPDVIDNGSNGALVPAADMSAFALRLGELLHDPASRAALGARARIDVLRRFDVARTAAQYATLYREALGLQLPTNVPVSLTNRN
ncbi:MAG TPA: glycosyltransferase, partial [Burkholderiaceae bacterium]|nr:glycosyltransferase [Burkholderiaceae bacterium]